MRVVSPKVHVEIFRPTYIPDKTNTGNPSTVKPDFLMEPNELTYIQVTEIEDRRIKGLQFEETALFGGFLEVNIAEDPQSSLFDRFVPNDHVEVFFSDTEEINLAKSLLFSTNAGKDYDYNISTPKFQGASWKTDLKYRPTMVTTQLHAWDYLRLMQYINIPRGKGQPEFGNLVEEVQKKGTLIKKLSVRSRREVYADNMLDYIDSALNSFIRSDDISVFGEQFTTLESSTGSETVGSLAFSKTYNAQNNLNPKVNLYVAGIGEDCHAKIRGNPLYSQFKEVGANVNFTWSSARSDKETSPDKNAELVREAVNNMGIRDAMIFRFLDGKFSRIKGYDKENAKFVFSDAGVNLAVDIVVISQFALMELLLKKITVDHGLNQWFTPILRIDEEFTRNVLSTSSQAGSAVSKLVYLRVMETRTRESESPIAVFNIDTFDFAKDFVSEAFKRAVGNIKKSTEGAPSSNRVDVLTEIITSIDFPQPKLENEDDKYSLKTLFDYSLTNNLIGSQREAVDDLLLRFDDDFDETAYENNDEPANPFFYRKLLKNARDYGTFIHTVLALDDKLMSFIQAVPASYMRADIYTGSKFNTLQYDSLAITRIIQLLASAMAGYPVTNNPQSNTEKGKIDSYPVFAANRIVIKPKAYFGKKTSEIQDEVYTYDLYSSLAEFYKRFGKESGQVKATCFLIIDVAKKKLKEANEPPEFIFPMEDIQDFGMVKASSVNHFFNFSMADQYKDYNLINILENIRDEDGNLIRDDNSRLQRVVKNVVTNGLFIQYREAGLEIAGFSPPEHQHLTLSDLTQNENYDPWSNRIAPNSSADDSVNTSKPVFDPWNAYVFRSNANGTDLVAPTPHRRYFTINNYDKFEPIDVVWVSEEGTQGGQLQLLNGTVVSDESVTINTPYHGITQYVDISDIKREFETLRTIMTNDNIAYKDISNVDLDLMKNIYLRVPLNFYVDLTAVEYKDKIQIRAPSGFGLVEAEKNLYDIIIKVTDQLRKIDLDAMHWLFPYNGIEIESGTGRRSPTDFHPSNAEGTHAKHLFLISYLDLLLKGIRYILWSIGKARFFAHVYLPIEYSKYAVRANNLIPDKILLEPGSSVQITIDENNSLNTSVNSPLISFPIQGLEKEGHRPLVNSVARKTTEIDGIVQEEESKVRQMTWYVSKKVTYIGADTGAMVRVEMTEGSLDWTLFYNEKNLLTQVSEHYLLNGLGNFRAGYRGNFL